MGGRTDWKCPYITQTQLGEHDVVRQMTANKHVFREVVSSAFAFICWSMSHFHQTDVLRLAVYSSGEDLEAQQLLRDTVFMVTKQSRCCNSLPFDLASNCCCSAILILGYAAWHEYIWFLSNEEEEKHWMHRGRGTCRRSSCLQIKSETNTEHESVTLQNVIGAVPSKSHRDNLGWHRNPSGDWYDLTRSVASLAYQLEH